MANHERVRDKGDLEELALRCHDKALGDGNIGGQRKEVTVINRANYPNILFSPNVIPEDLNFNLVKLPCLPFHFGVVTFINTALQFNIRTGLQTVQLS
jgi:hypothetical protein